MKFIKIVLGVIVALVAAFLIGGMLLPSGQYVERSAVVKADTVPRARAEPPSPPRGWVATTRHHSPQPMQT